MVYRIPQPADKPRYLRQKFGEIARRYDLFNDIITQGQHRYWKNVLVQRLELAGHERVLDLCCGTGDIGLRCADKLTAGGSVVAVDFTPEMLHIARARIAQRKTSANGAQVAGVKVICGDAMRLPFPDASFHCITIGYGLRNVSDLNGCLAEMLRVLKPGGILASLDVGKVRSKIVAAINWLYFFYIVPWIGRMLQPGQELYNYLPRSTVDYPDQDRLKTILGECGLHRLEVIEFLFGASVIHLARKPDA